MANQNEDLHSLGAQTVKEKYPNLDTKTAIQTAKDFAKYFKAPLTPILEESISLLEKDPDNIHNVERFRLGITEHFVHHSDTNHPVLSHEVFKDSIYKDIKAVFSEALVQYELEKALESNK